MADVQAGWYPDPSGDVTKLRYWNGTQWTDDFTDAQTAQQQVVQERDYYNPNGTLAEVDRVYYQQQTAQGYVGSQDQTLALVAFILCLISTISAGVLLIPLAWMIPMTVHCWGIYKGTKSNTTGFGVCTLLFVNLVGGILLLVSKKS